MTGHEIAQGAPIQNQEEIQRRAAAWHAASEQHDMDWSGFSDWLSKNPLHQVAYDEIALADAAIQDHREFLQAAPYDGGGDVSVPKRQGGFGWTRWAGIAIAASLVAVVALPQFLTPSKATYTTRTTAQRIALKDGSAILLGPHSRLTVSVSGQDHLALSGGAWFDIHHDPEHARSIEAGSIEIGDIGTRFDVQAEGAQVRVAVAEGEVKVDSPALGAPIRLAQGRGLIFDGNAGTAILRDVTPASIGLWRSGRLTYRDTPLSLVATDISRYAGVRVEVAPSLRDRGFSGTLVINNGEAALRDLSQLMGLELAGNRGNYSLVDKHR